MKSLIKNFVLEIESLIIDKTSKPQKERDNCLVWVRYPKFCK